MESDPTRGNPNHGARFVLRAGGGSKSHQKNLFNFYSGLLAILCITSPNKTLSF